MAKVIQKSNFSGMKKSEKRILKAIQAGVLAEAEEIANDIRDSIHDPPGGSDRVYRIYKYGKRGQEHIPSAPGDPPVNLTGVLKNSIGAALTEDPFIRNIVVKIGVVHEYSTVPIEGDLHDPEIPRALELGTPKMRPRPFIQPALDRARASGLLNKLRYKVVEREYGIDE